MVLGDPWTHWKLQGKFLSTCREEKDKMWWREDNSVSLKKKKIGLFSSYFDVNYIKLRLVNTEVRKY